MKIVVTDYILLRKPSRCDLRIYLKEQGEPMDPPGAFEEMIKNLGIRQHGPN